MRVDRNLVGNPFFSICIPQYNRTSFIIEACLTLVHQTFKNFEICISDDCSTDGKEKELLQFLENSGLSFIYQRQERNCRYDANLRASISLARGDFCFLLGNDDGLASSQVLEQLYLDLQKYPSVGVVISNYEDFSTGEKTRRIIHKGLIGSGPEIAANHFRNFSFVSGILLHANKAKENATEKWDGSEMYQMYVGCRMIAKGASLLELDYSTVRRGIKIPGEEVDSYSLRPRLQPCPIVERLLPMRMIGRLVVDAVVEYVKPLKKQKIIKNVFFQIFLFTYPFWIVEYRRVQSWKYAVGVCLGMRPKNLLTGLAISLKNKVSLTLIYLGVSLLGLVFPVRLFPFFQSYFYSIAKKFR